MKFRNFCLVVLGDVVGAKDEIKRISESGLNILESKNIIISTFSTAVNISELNDYFKLNNRNFIIFEMLNGTYSAYLKDEKINEQLFESIKRKNPEVLEEMTNQLFTEILSQYKNRSTTTSHSGFSEPVSTIKHETAVEIKDDSEIEDFIKTLSETDKIQLINDLIDKGSDNLTDHDKKCLKFLTKK